MKKKSIKKNTPATQEDLEIWGGNLAFQIDEVRQDLSGFKAETHENFRKVDARFKKIDERFDKIDARFDTIEEQIRELKKTIDMNIDALSMLTQELREIKHIEFQVYNHENRIKKLEEAA